MDVSVISLLTTRWRNYQSKIEMKLLIMICSLYNSVSQSNHMILKRKNAHTHILINHHVTIVVDPLENQCMLFAMLLRHNIFSSKIVRPRRIVRSLDRSSSSCCSGGSISNSIFNII